MHLLSGATGYPIYPRMLYLGGIMPIWVPLLMGTGGWLGYMGPILRIKLQGRLAQSRSENPSASSDHPGHTSPATLTRHSAGPLIGAALVFTGLYAVSGFLPGGASSLWVNAILYAGALASWGAFDRSLACLVDCAGFAAGGTLFEIGLVHAGEFYYQAHQANLLGVPSWLPALYLSAGVALSAFKRCFPTNANRADAVSS